MAEHDDESMTPGAPQQDAPPSWAHIDFDQTQQGRNEETSKLLKGRRIAPMAGALAGAAALGAAVGAARGLLGRRSR